MQQPIKDFMASDETYRADRKSTVALKLCPQCLRAFSRDFYEECFCRYRFELPSDSVLAAKYAAESSHFKAAESKPVG